jgi:methyl-accepting chemotaxis protein
MAVQRLSSLSTRLVLAVLATATVTFSASVGLTFMRLNQGLERQASELGRLSEHKLGQELGGQAMLAGARVEMLFQSIGRRLEGIAQRADVVKAISSSNVVAISELLGRAGQAADIDGILAVDAKLRVVGADREDIDIVGTNQALHRNPLAKEILPILGDNDRRHPRVYRRTLELTSQLAEAIGARTSAPLSIIVVEPIFDDFGDVFAALIAYRSLRLHETTLEEFSRLEGAGLLVLAGDTPISAAGIASATLTVTNVTGSTLSRTSDGAFWVRCAGLFTEWRICALAPLADLYTLRDELVRIGASEGRALATWLIIIAVISLASFVAITLFLSRRISRPLAAITEAVRAVSRGDWKSGVAGTGRRDEVGDIARAVVVLQRSLEERDRLRSNVAHAESIKRRRETLEDAIKRFDRIMRSVLLSVSDSVENMDETARELARVSAVAEGEAVEASFVSESTVSNVSILRSATEQLSHAIAETMDQIRQTAEVIDASSNVARTATDKAERLTKAAKDMDEVIDVIDNLTAQTGTLALDAIRRAAESPSSADATSHVVAEIKELADRAARANSEIIRRVSTVRNVADDAVESVRTVAQKIELVLKQTKAIGLAIERQDAVTREIAESMSSAATGTANVSSSVERLKATIEEARGASMKVITKASDMADEAHRLNSTVKSFLREVTA